MTGPHDHRRSPNIPDLDRVDALLEQALDLTVAERTELIETLLFFDMVMSEPLDADQID